MAAKNLARRFLPSLRTTRHPAAASDQVKVVLGDYYAALSAAGIWMSTRARPWPVERAIADGYERIIYVFRSVEAIAGNASRLPFRLKQGEDVLDDHPLYRVLNGQANPMETGRQFRKRLGAQVLLSKRGAFAEKTLSRGGDIVRIDLLPPGRTRPVPGDDGVLIDHFEVIRADGTRSEIPAPNVIWFREPHPLDPYSGVTPLEAAGMSVELDFFTRMFNVQFLKNDGRPGGVLGVQGDMDDEDIEELERRFGRGPVEAGKLTVIAGDVSYTDTTVRPRDMQYQQMSQNAKIEILTAFAVPESILGYAGDRTFANASQEQLNFWQITMPPFLDLQVTGFDAESDPDLEGFFDVSDVPCLRALEAAKREEARAEFTAGLITPDEYREGTGRDQFGRPETRCLYMPAGLTPVPTSKADAEALSGTPLPPAIGGGGSGPQPPAAPQATAPEFPEERALAAQEAKALPPSIADKRPGMISLDVPAGTIPQIPGGVTGHHVTLVYLGADVDDDTFARATAAARAEAAATPPLKGTLGGLGVFPPGDDGTPVWATVDVPGLVELRQRLVTRLGGQASEHGFTPHVTRAYIAGGQALPAPLPPTPVAFPALTVHRGGDETVTAPFTGCGEVKTRRPLRAVPGGGSRSPGPRPVIKVIRGEVKTAAPTGPVSMPGEQEHDRLEAALAAALRALGTRWTARTAARLNSPKARKGTRHWQPAVDLKQDARGGTQPLDTTRAVDGAAWQADAETTARPIVRDAAVTAAVALTTALTAGAAAGLAGDAGTTVTAAVDEVVQMIGQAALRLALTLSTAISAADQAGADLTELGRIVREQGGHDVGVWADGVAAQAATATLNGARDAAAEAVTRALQQEGQDPAVVRQWFSRRDTKVRDSHRVADGQTRPLGGLFQVGDALLRYPGDPSGPPGEVFNCRCKISHRLVASGQWAPTPTGAVTSAAHARAKAM